VDQRKERCDKNRVTTNDEMQDRPQSSHRTFE
jgi:hypothetical protein